MKLSASGSLISTKTISDLGTIKEPSFLSSSRNTFFTNSRSWSSINPATEPSSKIASISSSVTVASLCLPTPKSRRSVFVVTVKITTNGLVTLERISIGVAITAAICSGFDCPIRFGTSSPTVMAIKVTISTTNTVADTSATPSRTPTL